MLRKGKKKTYWGSGQHGPQRLGDLGQVTSPLWASVSVSVNEAAGLKNRESEIRVTQTGLQETMGALDLQVLLRLLGEGCLSSVSKENSVPKSREVSQSSLEGMVRTC